MVFDQPHRRWLADAQRRDQQAESEIGRLHLSKQISEAQYWAADRYRSLVAQFRLVMATPMQTCTALGHVVANPVDEDAWRRGESGKAERPESDEEMRKRVLKQHGGVLGVLRELDDGREISRVLDAIVIDDRPCSSRALLVSRQGPRTGVAMPERIIRKGELTLLKRGLSALCGLWHMQEDAAGHKRPVRVLGTAQERQAWGREEKEVHFVYTDD
ncbi:hypothetical protein ACO2RV_04620 [Ancylobacter sp. VNQ12]|uniref:hypothetical protein n=1 Tax=Ancylobacter sp. VNQ12 TaxID=3400920 RepID=UPI003BFB3F69